MSKGLTASIVGDSMTPDASLFGYTPIQAVEWYRTLGDRGRLTYSKMAVVDILLIIPTYVLLLGCQFMALSQQSSKATLWNSKLWSYLPLFCGMFDLIESITHGAAVVMFPSWIPSTTHLIISCAATQFKFFGLFLSIMSVVSRSGLKYLLPEKTNDKMA
jgi:cytochrome bd-type quinol oxidase subunit 2